MRVDPPTTHAASQAPSGARATASRASGGASFADTLARASTASSSATTQTDAEELKSKRGESLRAVKDHRYARILEGERKGMYINQSGNAREGKAFERVRRDGREWHVYGTGENRVVVEVKDRTPDTPSPSTTDTATSSANGGAAAPQS